uniref:Uncharacterized protein n=1 Tax=Ananas comosus var. bracteatus TaxID=296719 RepID=A0A6V7PBY5_ANACO|nr:unnamed protein product [Ananas comosus var. bracteatus]
MAENTAICDCHQETVPKKATAAAVVEIIVPNSGSSNTTAALLSAKANLNRSRGQPLMQRVPDLLRRNKKHAEMFDPAVVAIGPYHRGKPHLSAMEDHKKEAAIAFAEPNTEAFYTKVLEIARECRKCYNDNNDPPPAMSDEEFSLMLFFDGCFILQFIDQFVKSELKGFTVSAHLHGFILRDMFLLENQLPYLLLEKLMGVKSVEIDKFMDQVAGTQGQWKEKENESSSKGIDWPHWHLLARLRMRQLGPEDEMAQLAWGSSWQSFRSVKELIESGITLRRGKTSFLRDVKFTQRLVCGELSLPQIIIDDLTRSRLLNMIALEMCSTAGGDYGSRRSCGFWIC